MAEYIDRESIYKTLAMENPFGWNNDDLAELLRQAKPADVAPVVRCKDCDHSWLDISGRCCSYGVCVDSTVPDDFYCAYAIRKEGE